jgi:hypothetical protein
MTQDPGAAIDPRTADVYTVLDELSDIVEAARAMPMSEKCVVNRNEVLDLLDAIRQMLPTAVQEAEVLLADRRRPTSSPVPSSSRRPPSRRTS